MAEQGKYNFLTEKVFLPSKGKPYLPTNPLSNGFVEMKYMTAKEEDILTSKSLIEKNTVIDVLLKSLIVSEINYDDLLVGDKEALTFAARVLGYGRSYETDITCPKCKNLERNYEFDLSKVEHKNIPGMDEWAQSQQEFEYKFPDKELTIKYKLLTNKDEDNITQELKGLEKLTNKTNISYDLTTRLKHIITAVNGNIDRTFINNFIDNQFLAMDSRTLRKVIRDNTPGIDSDVAFTCPSCGYQGNISLPIGPEFFWPGS
jgi:hypothetical protein